MPFFASLWTQNRRYEFATGVADSVSRVASLGILVASGMVALGAPMVELLFLGGRFTVGDSRECAAYFAVFSISMFLWSAQAIYSRAFYAAGNTFVPMAAGTAVTVISLPIYASLYHLYGAMGLAFASDLGIALQTLTIALLLHQRHMVSLASLDYAEMGRCLVASLVSGAAVWGLFRWVEEVARHYLRIDIRWTDLAVLIVGSLVWLVITKWVLERVGSALPRVMMKRLKLI